MTYSIELVYKTGSEAGVCTLSLLRFGKAKIFFFDVAHMKYKMKSWNEQQNEITTQVRLPGKPPDCYGTDVYC